MKMPKCIFFIFYLNMYFIEHFYLIQKADKKIQAIHCGKTIRVFSGPYFPVFGLNKGKYGPNKTAHLDTFHPVINNALN